MAQPWCAECCEPRRTFSQMWGSGLRGSRCPSPFQMPWGMRCWGNSLTRDPTAARTSHPSHSWAPDSFLVWRRPKRDREVSLCCFIWPREGTNIRCVCLLTWLTQSMACRVIVSHCLGPATLCLVEEDETSHLPASLYPGAGLQ